MRQMETHTSSFWQLRRNRRRPAGSHWKFPDIERRRAGLDDLKQSWIVVDEYNYDIAERSWYLEPHQEFRGRFSKSFVMQIAALFVKTRNVSVRVSRLD